MTSKQESGVPRRKSPWFPESRVPRPFEKWLYDLLHQVKWSDRRPRIPWLIVARQVAKENGCRIVFDTSRRWEESMYIFDYHHHGPAVLVGGAGEPVDVCSALLHELGHHLLSHRRQHSTRTLRGEIAAWQVAHELAGKYRLPLNAKIRRTALYTYRYAQQLEEVSGSKARTRVRPAPHSWQLEESRRSATISKGYGTFSTGKKGKLHAKRFIKRSTTRTERRRAAEEVQED